jgi:hexosaminidase
MLILALLLFAGVSQGQTRPDALWQYGYSVIPMPRSVSLSGADTTLDESWRIDHGTVPATGIALRSLLADFAGFHSLSLKQGQGEKTIRLAIAPGTIKTQAAPEIDRQAYQLTITPHRIEIAGNSAQGLFYGVQTLLQLARRGADGRLTVPNGAIEDWPKLELRFLHWDVNQHQDRMETLKRYLDWSARLKVNMIAFQFEDKFHFASRPEIGAPGAYTREQFQELVDYGLERHIQIVPLIQAPAHFSWALKHPELTEFREDGNNYEANLCDPRTYDLIFNMFDDLISASKGVDYFFASTDEMYYTGIDPRCSTPYNPENRSLLWIDFVRRAHDHLAKRGRRMLLWVEYPLLPEHAKLLPPDVIDAIIGNPHYLPDEKRLGIRQLAYTSMRALELNFPSNFNMGSEEGKLERTYKDLGSGRAWQGNPIGVFGAAWDASGGHNETFWLGWSAVAQWAWNPGAVSPDQHAAEFMRLYYGPRATGIVDIYRTLQAQAMAWERSWDRIPSRERPLAYGNSRGKGIGVQRHDMTLSVPELPELPSLGGKSDFREKYAGLITEARARADKNERLVHEIAAQFPLADRNRYNLEVMFALAKYIGHHWRLVLTLADAEQSLEQARAADARSAPEFAAAHLLAAHESTGKIETELASVYATLTAVFEKSCYPRGRSVDGRSFLHVQDDSKDYWAARRPDLSYMIAPEQSIGLPEWRAKLNALVRAYAQQHKIELKTLDELDE